MSPASTVTKIATEIPNGKLDEMLKVPKIRNTTAANVHVSKLSRANRRPYLSLIVRTGHRMCSLVK